MIVCIKFNDGLTMMFGDSYKPWRVQFDEFCWKNKSIGEIEQVTCCSNKWIGWGGLKWCPEEDFQHQLNREGCQSQDNDNPNARQYKDMTFRSDSTITKQAKRILQDARREQTDISLLWKGKLPKGA